MKKALCVTVALVLLLMMSATAFAHGGQGRNHRQAARPTAYAPCTAEGCDLVRPHLHGGNWFCGRMDGDYALCDFEGCAATALHEHDGVYYRCQPAGPVTGTGRGCCRQ